VLIAASGNVEWMCLPRMDSPGIPGAISRSFPQVWSHLGSGD
jgi:hypothetical protein